MSDELKRTLYVEIVGANDLMPKDGEGSASPYCVLEYDGQRQQTETKVKELNPVWNAVLSFTVFEHNAMDAQELRVSIFSAKKGIQRDPKFLGRVRIRGSAFAKRGEEAVVYHKLKRRRNLFSQVKGEIGLKVWWADEPLVPPPPPEAPQAEPTPEAPPAEPTPEAPAPPPSADPSSAAAADPAPPASEITPEVPPEPVPAPPSDPAPVPPAEPPVAPAEPAPAAGDEKDEHAPAEPKEPEAAAAADVKKDEVAVTLMSAEVIENEMLLRPVYWDHNLPYAYEVPWNNFIPSSVLDNPYVNLPRVEWV